MWIITNRGPLSVVQDFDNPALLLVRARQEGLLDELIGESKVDVPVFYDGSADYPHRASMSRFEFAEIVFEQIEQIDYPNFKNSVQSHQLRSLFHRVWVVLAELGHGPKYGRRLPLSREPRDPNNPESMPRSAFDDDGSILRK